MSDDRTFFGGETPQPGDNIGGPRHYEGGEGIGAIVAWNCPSCRTENSGALELGCVHCGAGKPGYHVGHPPPPAGNAEMIGASGSERARGGSIYAVAEQWAEQHPLASIAEAFVVGYELAHNQFTAHTMAAPPVTADVATLAPEGKARRTIVAALKLFRDQVLAQTPDEIESGEWCSPTEVDALVQQIEAES